MKTLLGYAEHYLRKSNWKDLALIKLCLSALGIIIGLMVPIRSRKMVLFSAIGVFIATYIPLMVRFLGIMLETDNDLD